MNTWKLRKFNLFNLMLLCALLTSVALACQSQTTTAAREIEPILSGNSFVVRNYDGKYFNVGGAPQVACAAVFLSHCNGTAPHQVWQQKSIQDRSFNQQSGNQQSGSQRSGNQWSGNQWFDSQRSCPLPIMPAQIACFGTPATSTLQPEDQELSVPNSHRDMGLR